MNNISFKFWQSLFQKNGEKIGRKKMQFYDRFLQNDMLLSLPQPPLVCQYIYPSFLLSSFFPFDRKRQETWNISPFFSSLTRLVKTSWREVLCHFSATTNQQNITTSLHHRNRLSLKGLNSSSIFFETLAKNAVKGHQEHNTVLLLKLQNLIVSILFFLIYSTFPFLFLSYYMLCCEWKLLVIYLISTKRCW